jgi:hypothetical protein
VQVFAADQRPRVVANAFLPGSAHRGPLPRVRGDAAEQAGQTVAITGPRAPVAAASSAARPDRLSGRGAPAPIAVLAAIGIAVIVSVGIAHSSLGVLWLVLALLIVRRLIRHGAIR